MQVTNKSNDAKMNQVLRPTIAYRIMSYGMRHGWFTGKKLSDFIRPGKAADYYYAREIINGLDRAGTIGGYAQKLEPILRHSLFH